MDIEKCEKCEHHSNRLEIRVLPAVNLYPAPYDYCNLYEQRCAFIRKCEEATNED